MICSRKRDAKQSAIARSPSLMAMTPSCPPTPSSLPTSWPHVDTTPSTLNLLEAESDTEKVGLECSVTRRAVVVEFATPLTLLLLLLVSIVLFRKASDMVACMVALILLVLALSHSAVAYVARQWSRWQRGGGCASDLLQEKHAVCANAACARRIMQQGQDVYLAYDTAFCSERCRSKRIETVPSGGV